MVVQGAGKGALILAAGKGTRMKSARPKVLQPVLEEPILWYLLNAVRASGIERIAVVVGAGGEEVASWLRDEFPQAEILWQREQLGTGHAVAVTRDWWTQFESVTILNGDLPLLRGEALTSLGESFSTSGGGAFLSFEPEDPASYGRVVRDGCTLRIVEKKDAIPEELAIAEVNSGVYMFDTQLLAGAIDVLRADNAQGEYYLPDVVSHISRQGRIVMAKLWPEPVDLSGVNDAFELAQVTDVMRRRILADAMEAGVKCVAPDTVWIGPKAEFGEDVWIEPQVHIYGTCRVGAGSRIGTGCILRNSVLGERCRLVAYVVFQDSCAAANVRMGPFAFIRDGALLGEHSLVGKFVEIKKSTVGRETKVPHLSYLGDATVGENTNIGAGTITCNYDGRDKHPTVIGDDCFIGSDTMFVAPVRMGDRAVTGAGSVITQDVPGDALAVARSRQRNIEGWNARRKTRGEEGKA